MQKNIGYIKSVLRDVPTNVRDTDKGLLVMRLGLGCFFVYHGLGYFFGFAPFTDIDTFAGTLGTIGFPAPHVWAYLVAFIELFGGLCLVLGFFTKAFGVLFAVIAVVAFSTVHHFTLGFGNGDIDILAFTMALSLIFSGPGKLSLEERWYREDLSRSEALLELKEVKQEEVEQKKQEVVKKEAIRLQQEKKNAEGKDDSVIFAGPATVEKNEKSGQGGTTPSKDAS